MRNKIKKFGKKIAAFVNLKIKRQLNKQRIYVPLINGIKVGISGEKWMSGVLGKLFRFDKGMFYDVGVNLGQTLLKVKTLDPARKYVGFDPNPSCLFYLQRLIEANSWEGVLIIPAGLSNSDGLIELFASDDTDPSATIIKEFRSVSEKFMKLVPIFRYESLQNMLPKDKVSFIKIDVEGAEIEVVETLLPLIMRDRPILLIEILPVEKETSSLRSARTKQVVNMLGSAKYVFYRIAKTADDDYAGLVRVDLLVHEDPVLKDHIAVPLEKIDSFKQVMSI